MKPSFLPLVFALSAFGGGSLPATDMRPTGAPLASLKPRNQRIDRKNRRRAHAAGKRNAF
jgi:hypothetical protein